MAYLARVRRLLKFLHTTGAIGMMGAMACLLVMLLAPAPTEVAAKRALSQDMAQIATWILEPSLALTLVAGLLGIAVTPGFHDAGWVWVKAATGILIFEGGLVHVLGPLQQAARETLAAFSAPTASQAAAALSGERNTLWVLIAVSAANVALGVWRPKLPQIPV